LGGGMRKKVIGLEAIGLVLLVDSLWDDYTKSWHNDLPQAFDNFKLKVAEGTKEAKSDNPTSEFWVRYGQWTRTNSDRGATIERRHIFFVEKMREMMKLQLKDPNRSF